MLFFLVFITWQVSASSAIYLQAVLPSWDMFGSCSSPSSASNSAVAGSGASSKYNLKYSPMRKPSGWKRQVKLKLELDFCWKKMAKSNLNLLCQDCLGFGSSQGDHSNEWPHLVAPDKGMQYGFSLPSKTAPQWVQGWLKCGVGSERNFWHFFGS